MMNGVSILLVILVAAAAMWAFAKSRQKMKKGGGCCGEHEEAAKRVGVSDRNKNHYPYMVSLKIEGMTCENCARRVENALNTLPGTWAKVEIGTHCATVRLKDAPDDHKLMQAVVEAGYGVSQVCSMNKA